MDLIWIVLPVFLIFGIGYAGQKRLKLNIKSISSMALYLMMPFLTFSTFYTNEITKEYVFLVLFNLLMILLGVLALFIGKLMRADKPTLSAMMITTTFSNTGNYGAPIVLFAFGQEAFNYAIIIMVMQSVFAYTIGTFIASIGSENNQGSRSVILKQSIISVLKMPILYGMGAGMLFQLMNVPLETSIQESIHLVGSASIPTVMLILGMQLAEIKTGKIDWKYVNVITGMRMVVSPLLIAFLVQYLPMSEVLKNVFIVLAAMPVAVNTALLAVQFNTKPNLVSYITFFTTMVSLVSVPLVLYLLK